MYRSEFLRVLVLSQEVWQVVRPDSLAVAATSEGGTRMTHQSVAELVHTLLNSENDAWRDDAAQALADVSDHAEAERALIAAIESPKLDDSLRRTCAESLAAIWIKTGEVPQEPMRKLTGAPRAVVEAFLRAAHLLPDGQ
jgi:cytochrome P450